MTQNPIFDRAAFLARLNNDESLFREVLEYFRGDGPRLLDEVKVAVKSHSAEALVNAAHALRGVLGTICAPRAYHAASKLEMIARGEQLKAKAKAVDRLKVEMKALASVIDAELYAAEIKVRA